MLRTCPDPFTVWPHFAEQHRPLPIAHRTAFAMGAGDDRGRCAGGVREGLPRGAVQVTEASCRWLLRIVVNETRNRWRWMLLLERRNRIRERYLSMVQAAMIRHAPWSWCA
jgi:hypothetical protein